jgi:hypothetical protein
MSEGTLRFIPLSYNNADSQASALRLVLSINPHWEGAGNNIELVRFTDGITNTVSLARHIPRGTQEMTYKLIHAVAFEDYQPKTRSDRRANRQ